MNRRDFLTLTTGAAATLPLLTTKSFAGPGTAKLKVLVLGGRGFFGPTLVDTLLQAGHKVTLFNRGFTNPDLFPELTWVRGDREIADGSGLSNLKVHLKKHKYDLVVDTWQKAPKAVLEMIKLLKGRIGQYQYVSSISVYKDKNTKGINEQYPLVDLSQSDINDKRMHYAYRKTWAETLLFQELGDKAATFRSHGMRSDRTPEPIYEPYWPARMLEGGEILLPQDTDHVMQVCDVKSMTHFMCLAAEQGIKGPFNIARETTSFSDYLDQVDKVTRQPHTKTWVPKAFLAEQGIEPYRDLPLWRPQLPGFYHIDVSKAIKAGLDNRGIKAMVTDQLAGYLKRNPNQDFLFGGRGTISRQKEQQVLAAWHQNQGRGA